MANLSNINNYFVVDTTGKVAIGDVSAATIPTLLTQLTLYDNTATASLVIQSGAASGKKYELGSSSTGKFQITDLDASVDRLTIATNGRIGIGTSNPVALLVLSQANGANIRFENQTTSRVCTVGEGVGTNDVFSFRGNSYRSTDTLSVVFSTDRVGIGIITPNEKLQVAGNIHAYAPNGIDAGLFASTAAGNTTAAVRSSGISHFNGGNVGIGTSSPSSKLHVVGANNTTAVKIDFPSADFDFSANSTSGYTTKFHMDNTGTYIGSNSAGRALIFQTNDTDRLYINGNTGNVGIGTDSPGRKLDVRTDDGVLIRGASGSVNAKLSFLPASGGRQWDFQNNSSNFQIKDESAGITRMFFHYNGRLAIGSDLTDPLGQVDIYRAAGLSGTAAIAITNGESNGKNWGISTEVVGGGDFALLQSASTGGTPTPTATNVRFIINNSGNVGIGTTSPQTKLEVNGGLVKIVENSNTAFYGGDYVRVFGTQSYAFRNSGGSAIAQISLTGNSYFNGGNVGIGTTSPGYKLHVAGTTLISGGLKVIGPGSYNTFQSGNDYALGLNDYNSVSQWWLKAYTTGDFALHENTQGDRFTIKAGGNVGIGTTSPYSRLDVNGVINNRTASADPNFTVTANGMSVQDSGSLQFTQGFAGTSSAGDTVVFTYSATSWKSWSLDYTFASTNGLVKGTIGGYNNNSGGGTNFFLANQMVLNTPVATNSGQTVIVTFTGNFGIHMMCDMRYSQGGGDGAPRADRASLTYNS